LAADVPDGASHSEEAFFELVIESRIALLTDFMD